MTQQWRLTARPNDFTKAEKLTMKIQYVMRNNLTKHQSPKKQNAIVKAFKFIFRYWTRSYWEERAKNLPDGGWVVEDFKTYSYLEDECNYIHYAYPPDFGFCVAFIGGSPTSVLRQAVKYAEKMNQNAKHF